MKKKLLQFKEPKFEDEFCSLDEDLRAIIYMGVAYVWAKFKKPIRVTSVYRGDDPDSVHMYWRGCDISTPDDIPSECSALASFFNNYAVYDPSRPTFRIAVYGDENHKDHIHLQTHPKTKIFFAPIDREIFLDSP